MTGAVGHANVSASACTSTDGNSGDDVCLQLTQHGYNDNKSDMAVSNATTATVWLPANGAGGAVQPSGDVGQDPPVQVFALHESPAQSQSITTLTPTQPYAAVTCNSIKLLINAATDGCATKTLQRVSQESDSVGVTQGDPSHTLAGVVDDRLASASTQEIATQRWEGTDREHRVTRSMSRSRGDKAIYKGLPITWAPRKPNPNIHTTPPPTDKTAAKLRQSSTPCRTVMPATTVLPPLHANSSVTGVTSSDKRGSIRSCSTDSGKTMAPTRMLPQLHGNIDVSVLSARAKVLAAALSCNIDGRKTVTPTLTPPRLQGGTDLTALTARAKAMTSLDNIDTHLIRWSRAVSPSISTPVSVDAAPQMASDVVQTRTQMRSASFGLTPEAPSEPLGTSPPAVQHGSAGTSSEGSPLQLKRCSPVLLPNAALHDLSGVASATSLDAVIATQPRTDTLCSPSFSFPLPVKPVVVRPYTAAGPLLPVGQTGADSGSSDESGSDDVGSDAKTQQHAAQPHASQILGLHYGAHRRQQALDAGMSAEEYDIQRKRELATLETSLAQRIAASAARRPMASTTALVPTRTNTIGVRSDKLKFPLWGGADLLNTFRPTNMLAHSNGVKQASAATARSRRQTHNVFTPYAKERHAPVKEAKEVVTVPHSPAASTPATLATAGQHTASPSVDVQPVPFAANVTPAIPSRTTRTSKHASVDGASTMTELGRLHITRAYTEKLKRVRAVPSTDTVPSPRHLQGKQDEGVTGSTSIHCTPPAKRACDTIAPVPSHALTNASADMSGAHVTPPATSVPEKDVMLDAFYAVLDDYGNAGGFGDDPYVDHQRDELDTDVAHTHHENAVAQRPEAASASGIAVIDSARSGVNEILSVMAAGIAGHAGDEPIDNVHAPGCVNVSDSIGGVSRVGRRKATDIDCNSIRKPKSSESNSSSERNSLSGDHKRGPVSDSSSSSSSDVSSSSSSESDSSSSSPNDVSSSSSSDSDSDSSDGTGDSSYSEDGGSSSGDNSAGPQPHSNPAGGRGRQAGEHETARQHQMASVQRLSQPKRTSQTAESQLSRSAGRTPSPVTAPSALRPGALTPTSRATKPIVMASPSIPGNTSSSFMQRSHSRPPTSTATTAVAIAKAAVKRGAPAASPGAKQAATIRGVRDASAPSRPVAVRMPNKLLASSSAAASAAPPFAARSQSAPHAGVVPSKAGSANWDAPVTNNHVMCACGTVYVRAAFHNHRSDSKKLVASGKAPADFVCATSPVLPLPSTAEMKMLIETSQFRAARDLACRLQTGMTLEERATQRSRSNVASTPAVAAAKSDDNCSGSDVDTKVRRH